MTTVSTTTTTTVICQNCNGLSDLDIRAICSDGMKERRADVLALQEIWGYGRSTDTLEGGYVLVRHCPAVPEGKSNGGRGGGVGFILSPSTARAWDGKVHVFGDQGWMVLIKLRRVSGAFIHIASGYAPHSGKPRDERDAFLETVQEVERSVPKADLLLLCADVNASTGTVKRNVPGWQFADRQRAAVLGQHGLPHVNVAGTNLVTALAESKLCVVNTFFQQHFNRHGSWRHMRTKNWHDLDRIIVRRSDLPFIKSCGTFSAMVDSDHRCVKVVVRLPLHKGKKRKKKKPRSRVVRSKLQTPGASARFVSAVVQKYNETERTGVHPYSRFAAAFSEAATATLSEAKAVRKCTSWFELRKTELDEAIRLRNKASDEVFRNPTRIARAALRLRRKIVKKEIETAQTLWVKNWEDVINRGHLASNPSGVWDAKKQIAKGLGLKKTVALPLFRKQDGGLSETEAESIAAKMAHFDVLLNTEPDVDQEMIDSMIQRAVNVSLAWTPADIEIGAALCKAKAGKATGDDDVFSEGMLVLWGTDDDPPPSRSIIREFIRYIWEKKDVPKEFLIGLMKLLPKKGDLSNLGNCIGIPLLIGSKLLS